MTQPKPLVMEDLSAVIPAAGFSSRMHQYKPLLKLGEKTMIEVVIRLFKECGIKDILVVTGYNQDLLNPVILKAGARPVFNPGFEIGMFGSIQTGAAHISSRNSGFFLLPVDIPAIRPATIQALFKAFEKNPENIIIPEFEQTPGHPPLIPAQLIPKITSMVPEANLGELLLSQKDCLIRLPVHDRGVLLDADTKEDYEILVKKYQDMDIPDKEECWSIIRQALPGETGIQSHLSLVADTALKLARAIEKGLNQKNKANLNIGLNMDLIQAAALLHDIKRKQENHARAGSHFLLSLGFQRVAAIVARHMTLVPGDGLREKEIVYFADKLCNGSLLDLDYAQRFKDKIKQFPDANTMILQRYEDTQHIQARIEDAAGRSISSIFK